MSLKPPKKKGFPRRFGRYVLEKSLSRGGMGEIFLAVPEGIQSRCVIKTIRTDLTGDKEFVGRFADEAKIMTRIAHSNVIRIFDCGKVGSDYYIAMEYTYGRDLGDVLDRAYERGEPLPKDLGLFITQQVLQGLHYIHNITAPDGRPMNLVHRDVSPQNVLMGFDGSIKLIDFGLARTELLPSRTQGALAVGKYGYMPPEQARHEKIDGRADLYSLGVVLFEVFTGDRLVDEQDQSTLWQRVLNPKHRRPSTVIPDLPREVDDMIVRAVGSKPKDRWSDAREWLDALNRFKTRVATKEKFLSHLRHLYPHASFEPPPTPDFSKGIDRAESSPKSMIFSMSEEAAKSVFGRGDLPVQFTQMVNMNDIMPELERRRRQESAPQQDNTVLDDALGPLASEPRMVITGEQAALVDMGGPEKTDEDRAALNSLASSQDETRIQVTEGPRPAGILADSEETAYARPPAGAFEEEPDDDTNRGPQVLIEDKFRDEEQTVMMDAPPPRGAQAAWEESITREEIARKDAKDTEEFNRGIRTPGQPAARRGRMIKERQRPSKEPEPNAVAMRATIGGDNKPTRPPNRRKPGRELELEEDTQPPMTTDEVAPNWLLLGLILMGLTIIILLVILLIQR